MAAQPSASVTHILMSHIGVSENGFAVQDANDVFLYHNDTFANMFGFAGQSMIGRPFVELMAWMYEKQRGARIEWPSLEAWVAYLGSVRRKSVHRQFEVDLIDGRWLWISEQTTDAGEIIMHCADITRQKRIELELRHAQTELARLALTDELTKAPNRRHFLQQLDQECLRSQRYQQPLCLAMLDLDHFKSVNDQFGHAGGDEVLKHFAQFLQTHLRTTDLMGRIGGEEFAILLPSTALKEALLVVRRVASQLGQARLLHIAPDFSYSFSGGIAQLPFDPGVGSEWLLGRADEALYQAKTGGRNQVRPYQSS